MANYDVIITGAGPYHSANLSDHQRLALNVYLLAVYYLSSSGVTDYATTNAAQANLLTNSAKAFAGIPTAEFPRVAAPQELAIWTQAIIGGNPTYVALGTANISSKMTAAKYLLAADDDALAKANIYLLGLILGVLT